ncbi:hypothetical protein [uncultured Maricaulis sp.]|uniref:hypothetical protein n=1 Tax=uncultured Maricaulis sp. TaxID=174710 RepID=UPI0030DAC818|tara:strand:- start:14514 stop:14714 length:201 start_codon:yes stop_codon:yes gene_type:complete
MSDSGSNENDRGRFTRQIRLYGGAAAACAALGSVQTTFGFPGGSFSFVLALIFTVSTFFAWMKSRA